MELFKAFFKHNEFVESSQRSVGLSVILCVKFQEQKSLFVTVKKFETLSATVKLYFWLDPSTFFPLQFNGQIKNIILETKL